MSHPTIRPYGPAPAVAPWGYPGRIPGFSFIYDGALQALEGEDAWAGARRWLEERERLPLEARYAVLCSGSNANPAQIELKSRRLRGDATVPLLLSRVADVRPAFAATVAGYGAIPATLVAAQGRASSLHVALYSAEQLEVVVATERSAYDLCTVNAEIVLSGGRRLSSAYAFLCRSGVLSLDPPHACSLGDYAQTQLLSLLFERLGPRAGLPALSDYLADPLPHRVALEESMRAASLAIPSGLDQAGAGLGQPQTVGAFLRG